jgi:hypothetical protein
MSLEGARPSLDTEAALRQAIEDAFDYRGDVSIRLKDGTSVEGYLYDRLSTPHLADAYLRLLPADGSPRLRVAYIDVAALVFSGADKAAGKRWEDWVRTYQEKKAAGEKNIGLEPEALA